jgi:hypothetical protein
VGLVTTKGTETIKLSTSGAPSAHSLVTSFGLHGLALIILLLIPAGALVHIAPQEKEVDVVFHRPALPEHVPPPPARAAAAGPRLGGPPPAPKPKPHAPPGPLAPRKPELPPGPEEPQPPKIGMTGILAFRDKFASLAKDKVAPRLGADAHYSEVDAVGPASSRTTLTTNTPGASGGINTSSLSRSVGGGGGGGPGGAGGIQGVSVGRATSSIAGIGGGERPVAHGGPGASRTDEEIQIVFDRYKASFYRLYNRALRNDPTLKGQMVLRLTIEPDGSVSMCKLQSSDMNAPDLADQVVKIVLTINFGAKEVKAVTISYPIDFLPAE